MKTSRAGGRKPYQLIAGIDIGSSAIRLSIAQTLAEGGYEILEEATRAIKLDRDAFRKGQIARSTINEAVEILNNYKVLCQQYKVKKIKAVATTALREAGNSDIFIDNIRTYTGIEVEQISAMKEVEYIYNAIQKNLWTDDSGTDEYKMLLKIGAGSAVMTLFDRKRIVFSQALPIGVVRLKEIYKHNLHDQCTYEEFLRFLVKHELGEIENHIPLKKVSRLYAVGPELDHLFDWVDAHFPGRDHLTSRRLSALTKKMDEWSNEEIDHHFDVPNEMSDTFYPVTQTCKLVAEHFHCPRIYVPHISLKEALIYDLCFLQQDSETKFEQIGQQLIANSLTLGNKLNFDEAHALQVMRFSDELFESLRYLHGLGMREKNYLLVAALLHDVGNALHVSSHHKHSHYIIMATDFFYISDTEKRLIANIARYHRRSFPKTTHSDYSRFNHKQRMMVTKLASILRLADSMDYTRRQVLRIKQIEPDRQSLIIHAESAGNIFGEVYNFQYKREMFSSFFGVQPKLVISEGKNES